MGKGPGPQPSGKAGLSIQTRGRGVGPASLEGQPLGAGLRGSTSLPGGTHRPSAGHGDRAGAPAGPSLRTRCSTSLPSGTELPGAGRGGRPASPAGLSVLAWAAGVDQPARRDSSSERGPRSSTRRPGGTSLRARCSTSLPSRTELPGAGRGGRPACSAGLSFLAWPAGVDQPARLDSSYERVPQRSTIRPGGTQPPGAGQRGWICRAGATQPPVAGRGGRPAGPSGLSL